MAEHRTLEAQILAGFHQALADNRLDVAEHLLCALEALDSDGTPGLALSEAFLALAGRSPRH